MIRRLRRDLVTLVVVTLLVTTVLGASVLWVLTLLRDALLGMIPMLSFGTLW